MPSIYQLKPAFQNLLRPLSNALAKHGVTPNQVTIAALLLSIVTGILLAGFGSHRAIWFMVPLVMLVRMGLNAIDGMLAREHDMQTNLGAILNELGDVVSDSVLFLPLCFLPGIEPGIVVCFVLLANLSEMAGVVSVQIGGDRRYDGPAGKSDRVFLVGLISVVNALGWSVGTLANWGLIFACLAIIFTIRNRIYGALVDSKGVRAHGEL